MALASPQGVAPRRPHSPAALWAGGRQGKAALEELEVETRRAEEGEARDRVAADEDGPSSPAPAPAPASASGAALPQIPDLLLHASRRRRRRAASAGELAANRAELDRERAERTVLLRVQLELADGAQLAPSRPESPAPTAETVSRHRARLLGSSPQQRSPAPAPVSAAALDAAADARGADGELSSSSAAAETGIAERPSCEPARAVDGGAAAAAVAAEAAEHEVRSPDAAEHFASFSSAPRASAEEMEQLLHSAADALAEEAMSAATAEVARERCDAPLRRLAGDLAASAIDVALAAACGRSRQRRRLAGIDETSAIVYSP